MTKFDYKILWSGVIKEIREEIAEILEKRKIEREKYQNYNPIINLKILFEDKNE